MNQPPAKLSGRYRTPRPPSAEVYPGVALLDLFNFFSLYYRVPSPDRMGAVMQRIIDLQLLLKAEHRYGVAGGVHGLMRLHEKQPQVATAWRAMWPRQMALMDSFRPPEDDSEVSKSSEIDYLWMYGITCQDEYTIDRIVRIGMRKDMVGDAAVAVLYHHAMHPLVIPALARANATTTTDVPRAESGLAASVKALAQYAAVNPHFQAAILFIGWRPPAKQLNETKETLVVKTPDGRLPMHFPMVWDGYPVTAAQAAPAELETWRRLHSAKELP